MLWSAIKASACQHCYRHILHCQYAATIPPEIVSQNWSAMQSPYSNGDVHLAPTEWMWICTYEMRQQTLHLRHGFDPSPTRCIVMQRPMTWRFTPLPCAPIRVADVYDNVGQNITTRHIGLVIIPKWFILNARIRHLPKNTAPSNQSYYL